MSSSVLSMLQLTQISPHLLQIAEKVLAKERISASDGNVLYSEGSLPFLSLLADVVNQRVNNNHVFFNRNFHIEPTNICINHCAFCSYRRHQEEEGCWDLSISDIRRIVESYHDSGATEVHIVGG